MSMFWLSPYISCQANFSKAPSLFWYSPDYGPMMTSSCIMYWFGTLGQSNKKQSFQLSTRSQQHCLMEIK